MSTRSSLSLAANGYTDLYVLLERGEDLPLDFIKCPLAPDGRSEVAQARAFRPVLLHGWGPPGFSATARTIPELSMLTELAPISGSPWLSVHLDYMPEKDGELSRAALLRQISGNVKTLSDTSGLRVLLENVPHYAGRPKPLLSSDPDFISEALQESGAAFLLDLAHARVAAYHRQEDIHEYLSHLPLHLVKEIHISGPRMEATGLMDRHLTLQTEDWALLSWTLARTPDVAILTHEYMGLRPKTAPYPDSHGPEPLRRELHRMDALGRQHERFTVTACLSPHPR